MTKKLFSILAILWLTLFGFSNAYEYSNAITFQWSYNIWTEALGFQVVDWSWNIMVNWRGSWSCWKNLTNISNWDEYFFEEIGCGVNWTFWSNNTITIKLIYPDPPLIQWGTEAFSGVLTSVSSSVSEFIPYIVYIWIWLLTASIWFVAIKRLINRLKSKFLNPFRK